MHMKKTILFISLLIWLIPTKAENRLIVQPISGSNQSFALSLIGNIQFRGDTMCLYDKFNTELGCTPIANIGRMIFTDAETSFDTSTSSIIIYPNPTNNNLIVHGLDARQIIRIYSMQGILLNSCESSGLETIINVSELPQGTYLLQVGAEIVEFIKQ